jgi:uncharacterized protein (DUF2141 family)
MTPLLALGFPQERDRPPGVSVELVLMTRSDRGHVYCALWPSADGYPTRRERAVPESRATRIRDHEARIRFVAEPGTYAAACFHDENASRRLDTNFLGIPAEGTGASNDAQGFLGPPRFEDARFVLTSTASLDIHLRYV